LRASATNSGIPSPLAALALLIVPVLILEERATSELVKQIAYIANQVVWLAFCGEFSSSTWSFNLAPQLAIIDSRCTMR
jgi:hypothetical protein